MNLTVKHISHAEQIASALNKIKPGSGTYYMSGYYTRHLTEKAAIDAQRSTP